MGKISEALLRWRDKRKEGSIMKSSTFKKIARERGKKVAGFAYWQAAKAKFKKRKKE